MDRIEEIIRSQDQKERQAAAEREREARERIEAALRRAVGDPERGAAELARINAALVELDAAAWAAVDSTEVTAYIRKLSHTIIGVLASKTILRDATIEAKRNARRARVVRWVRS